MILREPEQAPQPIESERVQHSVSGPMLVLLSATLVGILAVADAFVLDAIFGEFPRLWLGLILVLELGLVAAAVALRPDLRPRVRWSALEIVGTFMVGAAFLAHALYLAPPDLMPTSFSVDCPHQHLLVNYVYQTDSFPDDVSYLYIYDDYPVAASAWAAFGARLLGVLPAQAMYPLAALMVAAQVMLVYGISIELLPRRPSSHAIAALAALSVFLPYQYSVGAFTEWFFSNMILGDLLVVLTLWLITVREKIHPAVSFVALLLLAFGCLNSYPAWAPFVLVPGLASIMLDRRLTIRRRMATAGLLAVLVAALTLVAVLDQWDFVTWFAPVRDRRLLPGWESLGGLFLIPVLGGIWIAARAWRRMLGFALFLVVDLALVAALYVVALLDKLALYIPDKTFYFNVFVLAVLAALSLNWLWERLLRTIKIRKPAAPAQATAQPIGDSTAGILRRPGRQESLIVALGLVAICIAVVAVVDWQHPAQSVYPISLDEYRVGYELAEQMPDAEVAFLVRSHATFYWLYGSVFNRTPDLERQSQLWQADPPTYDGWIADPASPSIAIVSDLTSMPEDGLWRPLIRSGNSAAIEKMR